MTGGTSSTNGVALFRCRCCEAYWLCWRGHLDLNGVTVQAVWSLLDEHQRPGACCDNNAQMGEQVAFVRDIIATDRRPVQERLIAAVEEVERLRVEMRGEIDRMLTSQRWVEAVLARHANDNA